MGAVILPGASVDRIRSNGAARGETMQWLIQRTPQTMRWRAAKALDLTSSCFSSGAGEDAPTASNIIDAVELLRQARETDTVVLFIAGHGINEGPSYRFLPTDATWIDGALRGSTARSNSDCVVCRRTDAR